MEYNKTKKGIEIILDYNICLDETFNCGQCFRFDQDDNNVFSGVAFNKTLRLYKEDNVIVLLDVEEEEFIEYWKDYFDLDLNYKDVQEELSAINPILKEACRFAPGIRILAQDPWEALCSFIISQNNNIKRIKGIIQKLCETFGHEISKNKYTFPSASCLSKLNVEDLSILKCGFRDKYILDAAQKVSSNEINLDAVKQMPIDQARIELMKIKGVGPKVAECVLLYGMHRLEAFPIDVWMKRALKNLLPEVSVSDFGEYAGIAQQYIFHYSRMHPELFLTVDN